MSLPSPPLGDRITKGRQSRFDGLDHNLGAGDGAIWDMRNLTGDLFPLLATREKRRLVRTLSTPNGLTAWDGLVWVDGDGLYYKGERKGTVANSRKRFAALGAYLVILPDKKYLNTLTGEFGSLESQWSGSSLTFTNGKLFEEEADANCIQAAGVSWGSFFRTGDAVTISGCTKHPANNKTPVIREIDGDKLYFYENVFTLDGEEGTTPYTETGNMKLERTVPDLEFLLENENRLWGCAGDTIYASKLGDIFNWNVYEGLDTDSYAVDTGSAGTFTGCVSFLGYPIFFKEDRIFKVYGSRPENYQIMASATLGVAKGSDRSIAIAGEMLFYLSSAGFMLYSGGIPQPIGDAFGRLRLKNAVGGSDGLKYYASAQDNTGVKRLFVYDSRHQTWHAEDEVVPVAFCREDAVTYLLAEDGKLWTVGGTGTGTEEADFTWFAEFSDFTEDSQDKKSVVRLQIRLELDEGASCKALIRYDSVGDWEQAGEVMETDVKRSRILPLIPRRADHYRLRLEGKGGCRVYAITRSYDPGSEIKSRK